MSSSAVSDVTQHLTERIHEWGVFCQVLHLHLISFHLLEQLSQATLLNPVPGTLDLTEKTILFQFLSGTFNFAF